MVRDRMSDPFDRAETCRARAAELGAAAARTSEPDAEAALLTLADTLEQHARTLEAAAIKFRVTRRVVPTRRTADREIEAAAD